MAMPNSSRGERHLAEINMVPLIDVMLVLLVIFIVTAPLLTHAVKIDLPKANADATQPKAPVQLAIRANGDLFWNGEPVSQASLTQRMTEAAKQQPVPELRIHADRLTPYEHIAQVMALAARMGLSRIGFVTVSES
ncbi:biopolymer transporter ExbD [Rhodoferax sp.]|jgi:biopolymer transport protein ExbD|uniref:ExbD/TolR family protein n=1 Tax=Rhodoferax sp. TaxID=50421 RepID=UPI002849B255|nr:biopolymer transporter ExbD [Rhodoferax sp.]MDR3369348.1 biopolymer transporter ExbD [Rhodoferax sp.]